mgnify:CR=1 FL=1
MLRRELGKDYDTKIMEDGLTSREDVEGRGGEEDGKGKGERRRKLEGGDENESKVVREEVEKNEMEEINWKEEEEEGKGSDEGADDMHIMKERNKEEEGERKRYGKVEERTLSKRKKIDGINKVKVEEEGDDDNESLLHPLFVKYRFFRSKV